MVDWDHLRVFLAVARAGQFLGAARSLKLDHTTVSRRISRLENALGARLFERRADGCIPTSAGERLILVAERVESEILGGCEDLSRDNAGLNGVVRVGAPDGIGSYFLAPLLAGFAERNPGLTIQLVPLPRAFSLSKREADLAVTIERPTEGRLFATKLVDYGLSLYASSRHISERGPVRSIRDLAGHTVVTYVDDLVYSGALDYAKLIDGVGVRRFECASVVGQLEAVRAGSGIGILHDHIARKYPELVIVLPEISATRSYWLVSHADTRHLARNAAVWSFLIEELKKAQSLFRRDGDIWRPAVVETGAATG